MNNTNGGMYFSFWLNKQKNLQAQGNTKVTKRIQKTQKESIAKKNRICRTEATARTENSTEPRRNQSKKKFRSPRLDLEQERREKQRLWIATRMIPCHKLRREP